MKWGNYPLAWFGFLAGLLVLFAIGEIAGLGTTHLRRDLFPLLFGAFSALVIHANLERGK